MTNGEKILTGIVVIAAIITTIIVITSNNAKNRIEKQKNEIDNIEDYLNGVDENNINNNSTDNELNENEINNEIRNTTENNIIGKEEQESNNQNTELDNEKKAIELAQKEWGLSINAYSFEAKLQDDGNYKVTVRGKTGNLEEIVTYMVDVTKGTVKDITE